MSSRLPISHASIPRGPMRPSSVSKGFTIGCIGIYALLSLWYFIQPLPKLRAIGDKLKGAGKKGLGDFGKRWEAGLEEGLKFVHKSGPPSIKMAGAASSGGAAEDKHVQALEAAKRAEKKATDAEKRAAEAEKRAAELEKKLATLAEQVTESVIARYESRKRKMTSAEVLERISYWKRPKLKTPLSKTFPQHQHKYITHEADYGGFNNIRMSFEAVIITAMVLGRTYVVPPPCPWYLINWGPIKRSEAQGDNVGGVSHVSDFFDIEDLNKIIPVISHEEFMQRHQQDKSVDDVRIPSELPGDERSCEYPLAMWFRKEPPGVSLASGHMNLLSHAIHWPSIQAVQNSRNKPPLSFISGRRHSEISLQQQNATVLHFAMNVNDKEHKDERYLGQVAAMFAFEDLAHQKEIFRALRDGFHYKQQVFEVASKVVAKLGFEGFFAFHIRRNELQYKESYVPAKRSLDAASNLIRPHENIYLSTDEMEPTFFDNWVERGHKIFRYQDFFEEKGGKVLEGVEGAKDPKLIGLIEQVICACARIFFQTPNSTFSAYITRLRGHFGVNSNVYYHTQEPYAANSKGSRPDGINNDFYVEFPEVFELDRRRRRLLEESSRAPVDVAILDAFLQSLLESD